MSNKQDLVDYASIQGKILIEIQTGTRVKKTMTKIADACSQMLIQGIEINPTKIVEFTKRKNYLSKPLGESTIYNDALPTGKQHYVELLGVFQGVCPIHSKKIKNGSTTNNGATKDEKEIPQEIQIKINNLINRNETLENALKEQFSIQEGKSTISIRSLIKQGTSGDDSVNIESQESRISNSQRQSIRKILGILHERVPSILEVGDGDNKRLFDNDTQMNILDKVEYSTLISLIEEY
jgi:hypothetical protein